MAKKKEERKYCNVALLPEDHDMLNALASEDQNLNCSVRRFRARIKY